MAERVRNDVLCLPTSPRIAPFKNTDMGKIEITYRYQAMGLLCISGLGGLPQISLPLTELEGMPLGLSLVARHGNDEMLLQFAKSITDNDTSFGGARHSACFLLGINNS